MNWDHRKARVSFFVAIFFLPGVATMGQATDQDGLAAKLANPVGSVYSLPVEVTVDNGADNGDAVFVNFQPIIPVSITEEWNLINRTIIPIIDAPGTPAGKPGNPTPSTGNKRLVWEI